MDFPDDGYEAATDGDREHDEPRPHGNPVECNICRDVVYPTYQEPEFLDKIRGKPLRKVYENDAGRLICPCKCSGSIKWTHESCLQEWRYSQAGTDNQWKCSRCGYQYRFERMDWARRLRSPVLAFVLAIAIVLLTVFLLGFVGDRILDLWLDPVGTVYDVFGGEADTWDLDMDLDGALGGIPIPEIDEEGWGFHFLKGLFSLGLVGFVKAFLAMSPFQWWNLRTSGIVGGGARRRGTGRDRLEDVNLMLVVIGAATFFWAVWKGTRKWTQKALDKTSERIMNAQPVDDDDDDDDVDEDAAERNGTPDTPNAAPETTEPVEATQPAATEDPVDTAEFDFELKPKLRRGFL
ncbi:hypothetical protein BKA67DRAFT_655084 [Truncatella angustata]|uniref:RING-CH-type domain-containing protein n=1 Tax=Truncatella angustata TaxID=152316 RepID=A0A9P8URM3_9PEZI|nr:uncharacterized protein BKA67DRAFT_655084 [Truncatella angustata]KAH6656775.1 hypothetical protein BKA67DRAFT_655084 [Truncatella angustata]KAH8197901.1 hypothetical protein TruAng_007953 [Truncatella angustata]